MASFEEELLAKLSLSKNLEHAILHLTYDQPTH